MTEYTEEQLDAVWAKGKALSSQPPDKYRQDACGAWMERGEYGKRDSALGWEVDHIDPDGPDDISNWRPLQWKNNVSKSDGKLTCPVTSSGNTIVDKSR